MVTHLLQRPVVGTALEHLIKYSINVLFVDGFCLFVLRQGLYIALAILELARRDWPLTHRDPLASASCMNAATMLSLLVGV